ncbi:uncharacterized protein MYCFIDRAFT_210291 [Pseudocercospora fijiensis CIRAD86]|uniref:Uncharacterized protein n=1 Tax=Pseudocercospora fijiensis (strain CIRAD86) TaxID=383855 RepID=M3AM50_PSEFD|nr:uncharacterized protein MYCFIDRAFT_210291 [Pseudocercospora fijiensis CIRAD86]EME85661.1 hypothetical protein MYCFIDRAFT_210291 [Pseudocercospora fijiensis CIRAD86]
MSTFHMSKKLSEKANQNKKFGGKAAPKTAESAAPKKQGEAGKDWVTGEQSSTLKKTNSKAAVKEDDDAGEFDDVDLSDPPTEPTEAEKSGFEMIDHTDAPHSSRNTQADHKWKYPENFGENSKTDSE